MDADAAALLEVAGVVVPFGVDLTPAAGTAVCTNEHCTENMTTTLADEAQRIAGRYVLSEQLGRGGAGEVFRARDEVTGRVVALKRLPFAKAGTRGKTLAALFEREYHTLARLKHPLIVEVYDYGVVDEGPYYTMELLDGQDLSRLGRLPYPEVCGHLRDVASSLALLHAGRLVHRDVSPRNVRVMPDGAARLFDFGAVASFGTSTEIVGTPAFMAPEVAQMRPLDGRTDLYSLGAVGYFCLTGRTPFAAKHPHEVPDLANTPPLQPSTFAPDVPPELDRLILSMLSWDPLGRPETAAAVIDELTVIGRLPPEAHERAERSYLLSNALVGRNGELDAVLARVAAALEGRGGKVLIEGPSGIGKTRLAQEICLRATLDGAATLRADGESTHGRFGVAAALGLRLLEACPDVARRHAEPHLSLLRQLSPNLADALGGADAEQQLADPNERRLRCLGALRDWFLAVARERTLLVCVDDAHAADEDSLAFLVALGRESAVTNLLVLATLRTGSSTAAPDALSALREHAQRVKLKSLDAKASELLAGGLFGGAVNAGRVGNLLFTRSGGVPRQFIELAELMVQKKIARYQGGGWVLPLDVADDELPARSEEILAARLSGLGRDAIALGETLAVHASRMPLPIALALSELPTERRTHDALAELIADQVIVADSEGCRFRSDTIREALFSRLSPDARRRHQLRTAEALLGFDGSTVAERVEAAIHLVDAGEKDRGAGVLVSAAREFAAGAGSHHNPDPLVRALIRMVRTRDQQGCSDYELALLLFPLMPLAYYSSRWQFLLEYGERAIDIGLRITGLKRVAELEPEVGPAEAMKRGLGEGGAALAAQGTAFDLKTAISATIGVIPSCISVYGACFDSEAVTRIARAVAPLRLFGEGHLGHTMYLFATAEALIQGNESESRPLWARALEAFESPACAGLIGPARARALQGGALFMLGVLDSYRFGDGGLVAARRMEDLGVKAWEVTADQIRILYHSFRGESEEVKRYTERVEANAIEGAQTSQADVFWPALLLKAEVLAGDAMAARKRYVQLERRSREVVTLKPHADAARAAYLLLRGDVAESVALYERILPEFPIKTCVAWETTRAFYARALNASGAHGRARAVAEEVVSSMLPADHGYAGQFLEAKRQLALAESGLGNHDLAAALLDALLEQHGREENPLLVGLLHQARAEIAERASDPERAAKHRCEMSERFRSTRNPVLIAQCEGLRYATRRRGSSGATKEFTSSVVSNLHSGTSASLLSSLTDPSLILEALETAAEPYQTALEFLVSRTGARGAHLYAISDGELHLAWSTSEEGARPGTADELERWTTASAADPTAPEGRPYASLPAHPSDPADHRLIALRNQATGAIVGGVILEASEPDYDDTLTGLFAALARVLEERGVDGYGFLTA